LDNSSINSPMKVYDNDLSIGSPMSSEKKPELDHWQEIGWVKRLKILHASSLILFIFIASFSDGINIMRKIATQNIFKEHFKLQPEESQKLMSFMSLPIVFRIFFGIFIDSKFAKERKRIVIVCNTILTVIFLMIVCGMATTAGMLTNLLFTYQVCSELNTAILASYALEQARKDAIFGQQDI